METEEREQTYKFYVADSLHYRGQEKYITKRLSEIMYPQPEEEIDVESIVFRTVDKAKKIFGGEEGKDK